MPAQKRNKTEGNTAVRIQTVLKAPAVGARGSACVCTVNHPAPGIVWQAFKAGPQLGPMVWGAVSRQVMGQWELHNRGERLSSGVLGGEGGCVWGHNLCWGISV